MSDSKIVEEVEGILDRVDARQQARAQALHDASGVAPRATSGTQQSTLGGPLASPELALLSKLCTEQHASADDDSFAAVDVDIMISLTEKLQAHVDAAASVDLIKEAYKYIHDGSSKGGSATNMVEQWLKGSTTTNTSNTGPGILRFLILRNGLDAARILLSILTTHDINRRVISEDLVQSCISLLKHHVARNVGPTITGTGHLVALESGSSKMSSATTTSSPTPKKRRRSSAGGPATKELKKVYKHIFQTNCQLLSLFETMQQLVYTVSMDDQPLATLTSAAVSVFGMEAVQDGSSDLQLLTVSSIGLLVAIARKYDGIAILQQDLLAILPHLPCSKRTQRTFTTVNSDQVQAVTILILSLIQASIETPTMELPEEEGDPDSMPSAQQQQKLVLKKSGLNRCQALCDFLCHNLLERCAKKGGDGPSEYRPILTNLVEDLLLLHLVPQHAAASELLLLTLVRILANDVYKASSFCKIKSKRPPVEATYLTTAFECLGKICAHVAQILRHSREKPLSITKQRNDILNSKTKVVSCLCNKKSINKMMLDCDSCHGYFHFECVGLTSSSVDIAKWRCNDCTLKDICLEETSRFASLESIARQTKEQVLPIMETHVFRQLVLSHLGDADDGFARQVLLAQWIQELMMSSENGDGDGIPPTVLAKQFLAIWDTPLDGLVGSSHQGQLNKDGYHRLMVALAATKSGLVASFPRYMGQLLHLMSDKGSPTMRKLSVKALERIVDVDPKIMIHPKVKEAVTSRFNDEAKSVRKEIVSLVGKYVVKGPELANAFHSSLLPQLVDEGVSVKKEAVAVFGDILKTVPAYNGRAAACALMLQRAADPKEDDSVRDAIHALFSELWLQDTKVHSPMAKRQAIVDGPGDGTPNLSTEKPVARKASNVEQRCSIASEQMVEVVLSAGSNDQLTALLRDLLSGFTDADKDRRKSDRKKRKEMASSHCEHLCDALIEHLLGLEESREQMNQTTFGQRLVATIRTISAIVEVSPQEALRHVGTLLPYLKGDNGIGDARESEVVSEVCDIIYRVSRIMSRGEVLEHLAGGSFCDNLAKITFRFGSNAIGAAVRVLCELASNDALDDIDNLFRKKVLKLSTDFYKCLYKHVEVAEIQAANKKTQSNIARSLSVLGCLCRSHDVDKTDISWVEEAMDEESKVKEPDQLTWDNMIEACFQMFLAYLQKTDVKTRCAALKALGGIFISRPRVFLSLQQYGTIEAIMAPDSDPELQLQALRCWREILLAEEKRVESGDAKSKMEANANITASKKISGDQDSEATIVGGVLNQHIVRIYDMTLDRNAKLRFASVDLLSHLLRQGMVNPLRTVPYLFGLQGDVDSPDIRNLAKRLLTIEGEKRPEMLRQRVAAGVRQAYQHQRTVYPDREVTAGIRVVTGKKSKYVSIFGELFKESMGKTTKQKQSLFQNLLGLFDAGEDDDIVPTKKSKKAKETTELRMLSFTAEVLAYLPYSTASDPLFIVHQIQNLCSLQGSQHLDRIMAFLAGQGFPMDALDTNEKEDALEMAAKAKKPSKTEEAKRLSEKKFDMARFEELSKTAASFILLMRLSSYLKKVYNLSETRCFEYSPDGQERNLDKLASSPAEMPQFDSTVPGADLDGAICTYAEFRRSLREDLGGSPMNLDDDDTEDDAMLIDGSHSGEEGE